MESTAKLTTFVVFILIGARVFSLTFYAVDGHLWVEHLLVNLPGGPTGFLIVVNLLVFILAFFLDYFEPVSYTHLDVYKRQRLCRLPYA